MDITTKAWRETLIDNLLHSIRFRSSAYYRPELRAPWGFNIDVRGPTFHIVSHGKCWIEVNGVAKPVQLSAGDFVVLPRSDSHIVRIFQQLRLLIISTLSRAALRTNKGRLAPVARDRSRDWCVAGCNLRMARPTLFLRFFRLSSISRGEVKTPPRGSE